MLNNRLKSIISTILIISMIFGSVVTNFATGSGGNDVNVTDASYETKDPSSPYWEITESEGISALAGLDTPVQVGARVSLYDIETQDRLGTLDFVSNYEKYKDYRRISEYPKTKIIELNGNINPDISDNILEESDVVLDSNLAKVSVSFPNFLNTSFAGGGGTAEHIRKHYEQDEKVKELLQNFPNKKEVWKNFKQRKITILVEPMIAITNKINEPNSTYAFTCAEAGLMELAGYVYRYENSIPKYATKEEILEKVPFEKRILGYNISTHERLYKALPYGSFKDRPEYITMIPNYTGTVGLNGANSNYMVDRLGCFEITAATISEIATPCTIKFHPNGKYFGIDSNIDEKYSIKDINVGDEIKIIKTYEDNYFNPTITDEHTYNSYSFKINNKGEAEGSTITIDSNFTITNEMLDENSNIILYCVWNKTPIPPSSPTISENFVLYEDELSNVYDYNSITTDDNTRKITGTANISSTGLFHPYHTNWSACGRDAYCPIKGSATFSIKVKHEYTGIDYNNCILDEQQTTIGDGEYKIDTPLKEQETTYFLKTGKEINHTVVGYRDRDKDLRTYYTGNTKNKTAIRKALEKYSIYSANKPNKEEYTGYYKWEDKLSIPYTFEGNTINEVAYGAIPACNNGGYEEHCYTDEDGDEHCYSCSWHCHVGSIETSLEDTSYPVSALKNVYDNVIFTQHSFVGNDTSYGESIFPEQDNNTTGSVEVGEYNNTNAIGNIRTIDPIEYNGIVYNYSNISENERVIGGYNYKDLGKIEFYPFIRMRYKDTLSSNYNDAYILAQNKTGLKNFVIAEVGLENINNNGSSIDDSYTINVESMWDSHSTTMKGLNKNGINDINSVIHGGSVISLSTPDTNNYIGDDNKNISNTNLGIEAYILAIPDELKDTILNDDSEYYTVSEAKQALKTFIEDVICNLGHYRIEKLIAKGVYLPSQQTEFISNATIVYSANEGIADSFANKKLNKNGKYYFNSNDDSNNDNNSPTIDVIGGFTNYDISEFNIKSDIVDTDLQSKIRFYKNGTEKLTISSKDIKNNNNYDENTINNLIKNDKDWQKLNNVTGFVDNYIKALEFDVDGGHTRNNSRPNWYNEGQDGLSVIRLKANIRLGINKGNGRLADDGKLFEVNDPNLCGIAKNTYDLRNWNSSTLEDKIRTIRYQLSSSFYFQSGDTMRNDTNTDREPGYIGTIGNKTDSKALRVYLPNIQYIMKSKFIYLDNATVENTYK